jgi:DNA-binding NarL/FixJ family response regulator
MKDDVSGGQADMKKVSVILAEDHIKMAEHLRMLLEPEHHVEVVFEGVALVAAVLQKVPDVIIADITMPGMSGFVAAEKILALHPHARIIFSTVWNERAIIERALSEGIRGYVMKADAGEELVEAVHSVLRGGVFISSSARAALANRSSSF